MNQRELKELIEFLIEKDIAEFELERGDVKVRIKRASEHPGGTPYIHVAPLPAAPLVPAPAAPTSTASAPSTAAARETPEESGLHLVRSPIVGTFYEAPSPGAPPFVKVGDTVAAGQVLCIIEAMKLMNEIESDGTGEVAKKFVSNGQPVEYGQPLFGIRPSA